MTIRCSGPATCRGTLSIRTRGSRPRTLVSGRYTIPAGRTRTLSLRVGATGRRAIGSKRSLKVSARIVRSGSTKAVSKALTLRR